MGLRLGLAAGVGDAGVDAASVVVADRAADEAVVLETLDETREGALGEVDLLGQLLDSAVAPRGVGQASQHLVLAQREPVLALKRMLKGLSHAGMLGLELIPSI